MFKEEFYKYLSSKACETDSLINQGYSSRLGIMEESITDRVLLDINAKFEDKIFTRKFSRKQEGNTSGADWLWCIGERGSWFSLLIQAKIVNPKTQNCRYLKYKNQRKLLREFAKRNKFLPIYCIYSSPSLLNTDEQNTIINFDEFETGEWGCSFITPKHVKKIITLKTRKQTEILKFSFPWHLPFKIANDMNTSKLGIEVANSFSLIYNNIDDLGLRKTNSWQLERAINSPTRRVNWDYPNPNDLITPELPKIVTKFLEGKKTMIPVSNIIITSTEHILDNENREQHKLLMSPGENIEQFISNIEIQNFMKEFIKKNKKK